MNGKWVSSGLTILGFVGLAAITFAQVSNNTADTAKNTSAVQVIPLIQQELEHISEQVGEHTVEIKKSNDTLNTIQTDIAVIKTILQGQ